MDFHHVHEFFRNVTFFLGKLRGGRRMASQVQLAELRQQLKQMAPVPVPPGSTSPSPPSPTSPGPGLTSPQWVGHRHAPTPTTTPVSVNWTPKKCWREGVGMGGENVLQRKKAQPPNKKNCKGSGLPWKVSSKQKVERKVLASLKLT